MRSSRVGALLIGSDSPEPRLSKRMRRANEVICSEMRTTRGFSQKRSRLETKPGDENEVDWSGAHDLVGDVYVARRFAYFV